MTTPEGQIEGQLIVKLRAVRYEYRDDIGDRAALRRDSRKRFEQLNRVGLTDGVQMASSTACSTKS